MFIWSNSIDTTEIGSAGTQIQKMSSEYIHYSQNSIQLINYDNKIAYTPSLRSFIVEYKAKLTDSLHFGFASGYALLISDKLLKVLLDSNIENYQYFEAEVVYRKKSYKYFFFFIYGQNYDLIDYKNMSFWGESQAPYSDQYREPHERVGTLKKEIKVEKAEQIINWQKLYPEYPNRHYEVLKLNYSNIHTDMIRTPNYLGNHYMVSEKLRDKIIEQGCTGISFRIKDWRERPIL